MLSDAANYDELRSRFAWRVPDRYNIGVDVCDTWAAREPDKVALLHLAEHGGCTSVGFGALRDQSNRLANLLAAHGIARGDRLFTAVRSI